MKNLLWIFAGASLLLNAGFAFYLVSRTGMPEAAPVVAAKPLAVAQSTGPTLDQNVWPDIKTDDLKSLVTRLTASGFPPKVIRAIISAQLYASYSAQRKAVMGVEMNTAFWKDTTPDRDPKKIVELMRLGREAQKTIKDLLGELPDSEDPRSRLYNNRNLSFLPAEKAENVKTLLKTMEERRNELWASGYSQNMDRAKFDALEKEQKETLAQLLSPAEMAEYNMRNSQTAQRLRTSMEFFNPSEAEYRAIYPLQEGFDEKYNNSGFLSMTPELSRSYGEAQKAMKDQIKAALGPERAAEYERATDSNFRRTSQLVARLELPAATATSLYDLQQEFSKRRMESSRSVTSRDEFVEKQKALQAEASARVASLLGDPSRVELYKQYGGNWLQNMVPRPPTRK